MRTFISASQTQNLFFLSVSSQFYFSTEQNSHDPWHVAEVVSIDSEKRTFNSVTTLSADSFRYWKESFSLQGLFVRWIEQDWRISSLLNAPAHPTDIIVWVVFFPWKKEARRITWFTYISLLILSFFFLTFVESKFLSVGLNPRILCYKSNRFVRSFLPLTVHSLTRKSLLASYKSDWLLFKQQKRERERIRKDKRRCYCCCHWS